MHRGIWVLSESGTHIDMLGGVESATLPCQAIFPCDLWGDQLTEKRDAVCLRCRL